MAVAQEVDAPQDRRARNLRPPRDAAAVERTAHLSDPLRDHDAAWPGAGAAACRKWPRLWLNVPDPSHHPLGRHVASCRSDLTCDGSLPSPVWLTRRYDAAMTPLTSLAARRTRDEPPSRSGPNGGLRYGRGPACPRFPILRLSTLRRGAAAAATTAARGSRTRLGPLREPGSSPKPTLTSIATTLSLTSSPNPHPNP